MKIIYLTLSIITMTLNHDAHSDNPNVFHFNQLNDILLVNDNVMGGKSSSEFKRTKDAIEFSGIVSLENNGGFASLRMLWPFKPNQDFDKLRLTFTGDGKTYQFRLRTNRGFDGMAYVFEFATQVGIIQTLDMPLQQFIPSFRGQIVRNASKLKATDIQQMGLLIAQKQTGTFHLDIHTIELLTDN